MAGINSTATTPESRAEPELEYNLQPWGDVIYGTKEQLQSIGLGAGIPFPGEAGETREKIKVVDARGGKGFVKALPDHSWKVCQGLGYDGANGLYAPAGLSDEANAGTIKQHARDLLYWIDKRATEMRSQMDRGMPADQDDAPPPGEEVETEAVTIH